MLQHPLPLTAAPLPLAMSPGSPHGHRGVETYRNRFWVLNLCDGPGTGSITIGGTAVAFRRGTVLVVPPGVEHRYAFAGATTKIWCHFQAAAGAQPVPLPLASDLGERHATFRDELASAALRFAREPERAAAALWHLLWSLAAAPAAGRAADGPLAGRLLAHLDANLDAPLRPLPLARRFGVTPQHLGRVCRRATGWPLLGYLRRRRLDRAVHLLQSTDLAVAEVAARVGFADLQHFNKLMRRHTGRAPRALRQG